MCSLTDFPDLLVEDQIPSCEIDGKLHYSKTGHGDVHIYTSSVSSHPYISVLKEHPGAPTSKIPSGDFFLPVSDNLSERLQNAWYENGFHRVLEVLATCEDHKISNTLAKYLLSSVDLMGKIVSNIGIYNTEDREGSEKLIKDGIIQLLCWHPHCTKIAVLSKDDSVHIFSSQSQISPLLKANNQKNITSLAWRPLSGCELAVGCREGVFIWSVGDPNTVISRPSINSAVHLNAPNHKNISTITWNPHGELLVSGSRTEGVIWVWSVDRGEHVLLRRMGGNATRLLTWSPDGTKLLTATYSNVFRLWDCVQKWSFETWRGLGCSVVAAGFCPSSTLLVFATASEPFLYCLDSSSQTTVFQTTPDKPHAKIVADLTQIELSSGTVIGGLVDELTWDSKGRHLALTFRNSPLIALFMCVFSPHFHLVPKFFINGDEGEKPTCIAFENSFTEGANLTIAWSSGRVQYFPIIYKFEDSTHNIIGLNMSPNQTANQSSLHYHSF